MSAPWVMPGGHLLHVMGDEDNWGCRRVGHERLQRRQESLPGAQIEPGGGLVEQQQLRCAHERARQKDLLALTF